MSRSALKILIPAIALLMVGCRTAPIFEVQSSPIVASRAVSMGEVEQTIRQAGASLGWQMVPRGAGSIEGTLTLRDHRAVVDIKYDTKSYSIKYKDSSNLGYDGSTIHANYNGWVQRLDNTIRARLTGL
jgi:hypothetical protein